MASALRDLVARVEARRAPLHDLVDAARALARAGRSAEAEALYREVGERGGRGADLHRERAQALAALGDADGAREQVALALALAPDDVRLHHALAGLGGHDAETLALVWPDEWGPVPASADDALARCRRQSGPAARLVEGHLLVAGGAVGQAVTAYEESGRAGARTQALRLAGRDAEADAVEGTAGGGDAAGREAALRRAIEAGHGSAEVHLALVYAVISGQRYDEAIALARQGVRMFPASAALRRVLVWALLRQDRVAEARHQAERFVQQYGSDGALDHVVTLALPVVYRDQAEVDEARRAFERGLAELEAAVDPADTGRWGGLLSTHNFHLAYQGEDDRPLQERWGRLLSDVARAAITVPPPAVRPARERLRVGFVSPFWKGHTVGRLFSGWITERDRDRVEARVYLLGTPDVQTDAIRTAADAFWHSDATGTDLVAQAAAAIAADELDALVYPSVGMVAATGALASLRLAPVQAVAWGHPVTTGLDTVDLFLSSEAMEPPGAQAHYSERLVTLPGVGVVLARPPQAEPVPRAAFGLADGDTVYLCSQSLFKLLPRYDGLYAQIARRVPGAVLTFIEHPSRRVTDTTRARLADAFEEAGADPDRQLAFVPRLSARRFRSLHAAADVYLDAPGWSGGMTTVEALGAGLPPVTWPGPFMRGRHTSAMVQQLGLGELVAETLDGYVDLAVQLGEDAAERSRLRTEILGRGDRLFGDVSSVRALEAVLHEACAARRSS